MRAAHRTAIEGLGAPALLGRRRRSNGAAKLLRKTLAAGVNRFHPDPPAAIDAKKLGTE
jgi:hypothetical protein